MRLPAHSRRTNRRSALLALAGGSAALLAGTRRSEAGPPTPVYRGLTNPIASSTRLAATNGFTGNLVLEVTTQHDSHTAVAGSVTGENGTGVHGSATIGVSGAGQIGVLGDGMVGVRGVGGPAGAVGVHGLATDPAGVGVRGENASGLALEALGDTRLDGTATVRGMLRLQDPGSGDAVALSGNSTASGVTFAVDGPVAFKTSGTGRFSKGQSSRAITGVPTPPGAKILVTLNQNPGQGNALKYVKRTSDNGFTAYLVKPVPGRVDFSWFVLA